MTSTRPASDEITRRSGTASRRYIRAHLSLPNPWHDGRLRVEREKTSSPNHEGKKLGQKKMDRALIAHRQVLCLPLHSFDGSKKKRNKKSRFLFFIVAPLSAHRLVDSDASKPPASKLEHRVYKKTPNQLQTNSVTRS